jgi:hypothetical protein
MREVNPAVVEGRAGPRRLGGVSVPGGRHHPLGQPIDRRIGLG